MTKQPKAVNPFYVVLVVVGIAFTVSACAFFVMSVRQIRPEDLGAVDRGPFTQFFDQYGVILLGVELAILAAATVAAIGSDDYWERRAAMQSTGEAAPEGDGPQSKAAPPHAIDDRQDDSSRPSAGAPS